MTQTGRGTIVLGLSALIFLLAVVLRVGLLNIAPEFDELYHLLAARSWINEGTLAIRADPCCFLCLGQPDGWACCRVDRCGLHDCLAAGHS